MTTHWYKELQLRGLIQDTSDEEKLENAPEGTRFYIGFDPTAKSLQLGNLVPLIVSAHLVRAGFTPFILFGGATGAIGDPSGKDKERVLLSREELEANIRRQKIQVEEIFQPLGVTPNFVDNLDWTKDVTLLEFLRDTGKHFPVNYMLAKEVVKSRLNGSGISFTEFSYMLLQAFDFSHLYQEHGVKLQIGGSDQWGNITAGLELIRRKGLGPEGASDAVAFSFPLLTNSDGKKFGKSEDGAMWLDPEMTSPYQLHQFLINADDADVIKYLKVLTFLPLEEIEAIEKKVASAPEKREAQTRLADEVIGFIHGESVIQEVNRGRAVLFGGSLEGVSEDQLRDIFKEVPSIDLKKEEALSTPVADLFVSSGLTPSRGEAKRLIKQGGAYLNSERVDDPQKLVSEHSLPYESLLVLRSGKKKYHLIRMTSDE